METSTKSPINDKELVTCVGGCVIRYNKFREQEMLIVQRSNTDPGWPLHWEYPKGKVKEGEELEVALRREIKEETGLDIKIIRKINVIKYISDHKVAIIHNFLCELIDNNQAVQLSYEHSNFYWVKTFAELEMMISPEQFRTASKVFKSKSQLTNHDMDDHDEIIEELYNPNYINLMSTTVLR